ncbi:MAG TPA: DnaJ domain-containing protein [Nitrospirales bacterium]|nr:DnaJ domain-containing protein [Nitrospirales bacterium]
MASLDYYTALGITPDASDEDVKKAYRQLVFRYHPDRNPGDATAEVRIREINAAYEVLGDSEARRSYDRLRYGPDRRGWEEEKADPDVVLQAMQAKLADEGRKEVFGILMKQVSLVKEELRIIRARTVADQGYDAFKEPIVAERAREMVDELVAEDSRVRRRRLLDVAVKMMVSQRVVGEHDEGGQRRLLANFEEQYRQGMVAGYMSALELFYVRK